MGLKVYFDLTKFGIVVFVLLTAIAGYATGFQGEHLFDWQHFLGMLVGLYFVSSGSLALNQVQEWKLDQKMPRTSKRPIASGKIKPLAGALLAFFFIIAGLIRLYEVSPMASGIGFLSVVFYNGLYTLFLKPRWIYAAVPGAFPGALPVTIGYCSINSDIFNSESIYLFLILFLWQMPHFWALAIRFKNDYAQGGVPTLPVSLGVDKAIYQIGLYTFAYVGVALASPWFTSTSWLYLFLVLPGALIVLQKFFKYQKSHGQEGWLAFFMSVNVSLLIFLFVPVLDKWSFLVFSR